MACLKVSLFSSIILAFSVWSILFLIPTLLLLFDSSILRNCGCPFHASLQLAFRAHALQRSACLMLLFLQGLLHCPHPVLLILQFFLFDSNLGSTPQPLASLLRHSSSQPEASRDRPSNLPAQFGVTLQALSMPPGQLQSPFDRAPIFQCRLRNFLFSLHFELLVLHGLVRFLLFSVFNVLLCIPR